MYTTVYRCFTSEIQYTQCNTKWIMCLLILGEQKMHTHQCLAYIDAKSIWKIFHVIYSDPKTKTKKIK